MPMFYLAYTTLLLCSPFKIAAHINIVVSVPTCTLVYYTARYLPSTIDCTLWLPGLFIIVLPALIVGTFFFLGVMSLCFTKEKRWISMINTQLPERRLAPWIHSFHTINIRFLLTNKEWNKRSPTRVGIYGMSIDFLFKSMLRPKVWMLHCLL